MEPQFFSGEHRSIVGRAPVRYWGTFWAADDGAVSVVAEIVTGDGVRSYVSDQIAPAALGSMAHDDAVHLWIRRRIDSGRVPPGARIDSEFVARMLSARMLF